MCLMLICCCSVAQSFLTLCQPMDHSMPGSTVLHHLPEFAQTHVCWVDDAIQPSHPLSSLSPPAFNISQCQGHFQWVGSSHQVAKVLELQHKSFQCTFRLISFRMDRLDLLAIQGTLKSLLQVHSSKASIPRCSAFFTVQLSHPYITDAEAEVQILWPPVEKNWLIAKDHYPGKDCGQEEMEEAEDEIVR